ncbi:MAG TPA: hypothetical protein VGL48_09930 [Acidimicrobiales bacterium]
MTGNHQLDAIGVLHGLFEREGTDYWLFGGWAVDFHAGRITRPHTDIDVAVWRTDLARIGELLEQQGWSCVRQSDEDGYVQYRRGSIDIDVAFLAQDENGTVYTPLDEGRGDWPVGAFGQAEKELLGVRARVVGLSSLVADKSEVHPDPSAARKDQADIAVLIGLTRDE